MREPTVYIMASRRNGTLYTGVTANLGERAWQHRTGAVPGFTKRYGCKTLVWYKPTSEWMKRSHARSSSKGDHEPRNWP